MNSKPIFTYVTDVMSRNRRHVYFNVFFSLFCLGHIALMFVFVNFLFFNFDFAIFTFWYFVKCLENNFIFGFRGLEIYFKLTPLALVKKNH